MSSCVEKIRQILCLTICLGVAGCAYHGKIPRGVYTATPTDKRVDASLLVISDKNIAQKIVITDPTSAALYDFTLDVGDGTVVAVADALSAFVTRVDAGPASLENTYDFVAEVKLEAGLTRADCTGSMPNLAARQNGLCSLLTVSIRQAKNQTRRGTFSARRWSAFEQRGGASAVRWANKSTLYLFSPVLIPLYTQLQGSLLRRQFQTHLQEMLDDISGQLKGRPDLFNTEDVPAP